MDKLPALTTERRADETQSRGLQAIIIGTMRAYMKLVTCKDDPLTEFEMRMLLLLPGGLIAPV